MKRSYRVKILNNLSRYVLIIVSVFFILINLSSAQMSTIITGNVFRDYNDNAIRNAEEVGISGIVVTATNDEAPASTVTTTTGLNGDYTLPALTGTNARVEFTLPASLQYLNPSIAGGTTVQFVELSGGTVTNVNIGFFEASDYCQSDVNLATPCYANGDPLGTPQGADPWLVSFPANPGPTSGLNTYLANGEEIGSTWGLAYHRTTGNLFASAFMKRHSGFGPMGLDGLYTINILTGAVSQFVNLQNIGINTGVNNRVAGDLSLTPTDPSYDGNVWDDVGKVGIGDLDVSADNRYLWMVNANTRTLHRVFIGETGQVPTSADVTTYSIPNPGCANDDYQPWAVEIHNGSVYVGVTCTAETSQNVNNLSAHIMQLSGGVLSSIFSFPLNYERGSTATFGAGSTNADWRPWQSSFTRLTSGSVENDGNDLPNDDNASYPQPLFSGLEFLDDGTIAMGFADRYGHQIGYFNYQTDGVDTTLYEGIAGGDVLRACLVGGTLQLENNGSCGALPATGGANNMQGPGGGEFFYEDNYQATHDEVFVGGAAFQPGTDDLITTVFDPIVIRSGGTSWMNINTGAENDVYEIFGQQDPPAGGTTSTFGKANGLGDLEFMCAPAPLEIGNYIWFDADQDGIQGPAETPIAGVEVDLWADTDNDGIVDTFVATVTTDANGNYIFNSASITTNVPGVTFFDIDGNGVVNGPLELSGILPDTVYELRIDLDQPELDGLGLTNANQNSDTTNNNLTDLNDSDAVMVGNFAVITVLTGPTGANNHTLDYGFTVPLPATPTPTPSVTPIPNGTGQSAQPNSDNPVNPDSAEDSASTGSGSLFITIDGVVYEITSLPQTGETPFWRDWLLWESISTVGLIITIIMRRRTRKRHT